MHLFIVRVLGFGTHEVFVIPPAVDVGSEN